LVAAALASSAALAAGGVAVARHEATRVRYERASARLGEPGYDAARSDALYARALDHRRWAARAGWLAGIGLAFVVLAIGLRRAPGGSPASGPDAPARALLSALVDAGLLLGCLLAIELGREALGAPHAALAALVGPALGGALVGGLWGGMAAGGTPAARLLGVRVCDRDGRAPGARRGLLALLLWPFVLPWTPLVAPWVAWRRARGRPAPLGAAAPHLRWAGLRVVARGRAGPIRLDAGRDAG
ncbi:MAG TPA: hypothetical protein RMH99_15475, partial [Sandaracinaceae bacterium LLY-WYZ-13_1]|nr:hypothetical protein [Sandaracinaceae bacterium LLY-WYZ-13_1]